MNRFYSVKVKDTDGFIFDSKTEYERYYYLIEHKNELGISKIDRQVKFILLEGFRDKEGRKVRDITYIADFVITLNNSEIIIEDVKGYKGNITDVFKVKWKLMKYRYRDYTYKIIIKNKGKWEEL